MKFEDFEQDAFAMTEDIYKKLNLPGFEESKAEIEKYLGKKKGYKKNQYKYDDRTVRLVEENWGMALQGVGIFFIIDNCRSVRFADLGILEKQNLK